MYSEEADGPFTKKWEELTPTKKARDRESSPITPRNTLLSTIFFREKETSNKEGECGQRLELYLGCPRQTVLGETDPS